MKNLRGSVGCLAVVLAAMGGCTDSGPEARTTAEGTPGQQRSGLGLGAPVLVRDIQPTPPPSAQGSQPSDFVAVGSTRFFVAFDGHHAGELWKTDGTPEGTVLVQDIEPGGLSGSPDELTAAHGVLYFVAPENWTSPRLWRSDGTAEGTRPLFNGPSLKLKVTELEAVQGTLYFTASDGSPGTHLWTTDGTPEGTRLVKAFPAAGSEPQGLQGVGGTLFFTADDGVHGRELWKSDGTPEGTVLVKDLAPGPASSSVWGRTAAGTGSVLYFTTGGALWKSDGTPGGTVPLTNVLGGPLVVPEGPSLQVPSWLAVSGGTLYFSAKDGATGYELWKSDGTPAGTVRVKDIHPSGDSGPSFLIDVNGILLFHASHPDTGREVWASDGTADGTVRLTDIQPGGGTESVKGWFAVAGSRAYFFAHHGFGAHALWMSDGTPAGTREVRRLTPDSSGLGQALGFADGSLLFVADEGVHGLELWKTDGTPEGTVLVRDIDRGTHGSAIRFMMDLGGGRVLFPVSVEGGQELWSSDGTEAGTRRVQAGLTSPGYPSWRLGGVRYFNDGLGLWRSDGTPEGTFLVRDFSPGVSDGVVVVQAELGGRIFFCATTPDEGTELWASDGTAAGTVLVKDIRPGPASSRPFQMLNAGGTLYFVADDGVHGRELWKSDGTAAGTVMVKDLVPGTEGASVEEMEDLNGTLIFIASDDVPTGKKVLWRLGLDGQPRKIALSAPGVTPGAPHRLRVVNGTLLVFTTREPYVSALPELWSYDGMPEHATLLAKDSFFYIIDMAAVGRVLYFLAGDGLGGEGLWRSDGTVEGTSKVKDALQAPMDASYHPSSMLGLADRGLVLLRSWEGATGVEMWVSDGSEAGTSLVADLAPGPSMSDPRSYTRSADSVFFSADDGVHGAELWRLSLPPVPPDTTLPVLVCPATVTVEAPSASGATASWPDARVSDDVSASIPLTYSHVPGTAFPLGKTVVTVTARDAAGNEAGCAFDVVVRDSLPPVVSCPAGVEVEATGSGTPVSFAEATASDGVTASPEVTYSHAPGSTFPVGETSVTVTAKDAAGNTASCSFSVVVRDTKAPVITCPADVVVATRDASGRAVEYPAATVSDVVPGEPHQVAYSHASGSLFPVGTTPVTATVTDAAGHSASCSFLITVSQVREPEEGPGCAAAGGSPAGLLGLLLLLAWPSLGRARTRRS